MGVGFNFGPSSEHTAYCRKYAALKRLMATFDGVKIVGTFGTYPLTLTVSGTPADTAEQTLSPFYPLTVAKVYPPHAE